MNRRDHECGQDLPASAVPACFSCCCPASEWHWFRWVLAAQPVLALVLLLMT